MYFFAPGLVVFGAIAYQRGWAKRASRRSIYEGSVRQLDTARNRFATEPNMSNRLDFERCELDAMYERQRGRARRRLGIILIILGVLFALTHT